jgi:tyrosyl-tRNA synthetase
VADEEIRAGVPVYKALVNIGLCGTGGEAKRLIAGGGVKVNGERTTDQNANLSPEDFKEGRAHLVAGKKRHGFVRLG